MTYNPDRPPYIYEGIDPERPASAIQTVIEKIQTTADRIGSAFESAKQPGMPLSIVANVAREAPLGAMFVALMVGIAIGRRR